MTEQTQWSKIQLRNIQIEDLLSREEINIDLDNIRNMEELIRLFAKEGVTVEDYLDNVLTRHFAQLQKENEDVYKRQSLEMHLIVGYR